jgi:formylglycine-generating enzyme required for sulfatase activity
MLSMIALLSQAACRESTPPAGEQNAAMQSSQEELKSKPKAVASADAPGSADAAPPVVTVSDLKPEIPPDACPAGTIHVTGGEFWMGSERRRGAREERPRFLTRVADFCLDQYEVTSARYEGCIAAGQCTPPHGSQSTCNHGRRGDHPINCVDWHQAHAYCTSQGARLPSELEWEYAARGGQKYHPYSWGPEAPDGRTCWKSDHSCAVGSFEAGAFGLHDMSGNVWEWTNDWFGYYPWPNPSGQSKVFRGGGWSRRFDKWMRATLRNRTQPSSWGSHLGFRCARAIQNAECPFGVGSDPGACRHGVVDAECEDPRHQFNGLRCAPPGAPPCGPSHEAIAGHGCVLREGVARSARREGSAPEEAPVRARSPEFDPDCQLNQPKRPNAYAIRGGTHAARNTYGASLGCKNRDVGVGWNSACCP